MNKLQKDLYSLQDEKYRDFQSKLMPGVQKDSVIGIRIPVLRKFAKTYGKTEESKAFLKELPHFYYEENNLHMMLITSIKDYEECLMEIEKFLPYINNWATCDFAAPGCFSIHKKELLPHIKRWINSQETYTVRYGIGMMMRLYLDDDFDVSYLNMVACVSSEEYYVNMMIAWYFATALAKQWKETLPYIKDHKLSLWVHKKTIQKAVESYRISPQQKEYLKNFR